MPFVSKALPLRSKGAGRMLNLRELALCAAALLACPAGSQSSHQPSTQSPTRLWTLGPFHRAATSPVITPDRNASFRDPVSGDAIHWKALHTFNPAAAAEGNGIAVLYRAEDQSGNGAIGSHTSRLGLAESRDGVHFTSLPEPVFYPAHDTQ